MSDITRAVALLKAGELVAFPTETVYGLGADAHNPDAVEKIFIAKGRPPEHPLIVHVAEPKMVERWAIDIPKAAYKLAAKFWPGPLTMILKRHPDVPDAVTGGQDTIGLRVPNHPVALELLHKFAEDTDEPATGGLAAPSANRFGRISPTTILHVRAELGSKVSLIIDGGPCQVGIESTIVDLTGEQPRILRPGMIPASIIGKVLGVPLKTEAKTAEKKPRVSGSLDAHYAPHTELQLLTLSQLFELVHTALGVGSRIAVLASTASIFDSKHVIWRTASSDPEVYAHDLYATLRELDGLHCSLILVETPPADEAWRGVLDRLQRAAAGSGAK